MFGSAATGEYRSGTSDYDFVVEYPPLPAGVYADSYFGLLEDLERLLGGTRRVGGGLGHQESVFSPVGRADQRAAL